MSLILHFVLGFITSFLGTLTPSMLNMTTAKISLHKNKIEALKFAMGASLVVLAQAYIAILFTKFLRTNPAFVQALQKIAMVILGLLLSALNMFSIPFYCGVTTALDVAGWLKFTQQNIISFVVGSAIGTFALLALYANYANVIQKKSKGLTKNINIILSILTGGLALLTFIKMM